MPGLDRGGDSGDLGAGGACVARSCDFVGLGGVFLSHVLGPWEPSQLQQLRCLGVSREPWLRRLGRRAVRQRSRRTDHGDGWQRDPLPPARLRTCERHDPAAAPGPPVESNRLKMPAQHFPLEIAQILTEPGSMAPSPCQRLALKVWQPERFSPCAVAVWYPLKRHGSPRVNLATGFAFGSRYKTTFYLRSV